jgi:DnaJ-class molecular chaperone
MNLTTSLNTLGIGLEADEAQAKRAYKAQVRRWHPDQFPEGSATKAGAEEQLKQINIAYARVKEHLSRCRPNPIVTATAAQPPPDQGGADGHAPPGEKTKKRSWVNHLFDALNAYAGNRAGEPSAPPYDKTDINRRKSFGQVLDEMAGSRLPQNKSDNRATPQPLAAAPLPATGFTAVKGSVGKVGASESPGPVKPVGRVRGIGRSR